MPLLSFLLAPYRALLVNWSLVWRMTRREIATRIQSTMLGPLWLILAPLLSLAVYQFIFAVVFEVRWPMPEGAHTNSALVLFAGLTVFAIFGESISRAPGLVLENVAYVKKVVFPLEVLPWISLLSSMLNVIISFVLLLLLQTILDGPPPPAALLLPLILLPFVMTVLGLCWIISALGVYLRDTKHLITYFVPFAMFLTPLFYPIERVPAALRPYLYLNPTTITIEQVRDALFWGRVPDVRGFIIALVAGVLIASIGHWGFMRARRGFADVL